MRVATKVAINCCILLATLLGYASAATIDIGEQVGGESCFVQPVQFSNYRSFSYNIRASSDTSGVAPGCTPEQILISPLIMQSTCVFPKNNDRKCDNSSLAATGTTSSSGQSFPTTDAAAVCNLAFSQGSGTSFATAASLTSSYDSGVNNCSPSSLGYIYIQNNCPASSGDSKFLLRIEYQPLASSLSCSGSSSSSSYPNSNYTYSNTSWQGWYSWLIVCFFAVFLGVMLISICLRRRRRQQAQMTAMQPIQHTGMPPPPPPASAMYYNTNNGPPPGYPVVPGAFPHEPYQPGAPMTAAGAAAAGGSSQQPAVWYAHGKPPGGTTTGYPVV